MKRLWLIPMVALLSACSDVSHEPASSAKAAGASAVAPAVDPRAQVSLRKMADNLARKPVLSFTTNSTGERPIGTGQLAHFSARSQVRFSRPDKLFVDRVGEQEEWKLWYSGKQVIITDGKAYAATTVPGEVGQMLDTMARQYDMVLPGSELLFADPYQALMDNVLTGQHLGTHEVDGVQCEQLAFTQREIDWQIWIEAGDNPVPRKVVIDYKLLPGRPQFVANLSGWNFGAAGMGARVFEAQLPAGARKLSMQALLGSGDAK